MITYVVKCQLVVLQTMNITEDWFINFLSAEKLYFLYRGQHSLL